MTRQEMQQFFPDMFDFFQDVDNDHPFWIAVGEIDLDDVKNGDTILPDLEQVFAALHLIDDLHVVHDDLDQIKTHDELMEVLTKLYIAYLYRGHGVRMVKDVHGYDIELEIADQLMAMGIVAFHNLKSQRIQFQDAILDEVQHLKSMQDVAVDKELLNKKVEAFLEDLKERAQDYGENKNADHHVMAAVTEVHGLPEEYEFAKMLQEKADEIADHFPKVAGVVLIDPSPGSERAHFVPFKGSDEHYNLEQLLNKR